MAGLRAHVWPPPPSALKRLPGQPHRFFSQLLLEDSCIPPLLHQRGLNWTEPGQTQADLEMQDAPGSRGCKLSCEKGCCGQTCFGSTWFKPAIITSSHSPPPPLVSPVPGVCCLRGSPDRLTMSLPNVFSSCTVFSEMHTPRTHWKI